MIKLSRLNGDSFVLNCDMIEIIEANPDTVVSLTTGHKFVVRESIDDIIEKVVQYNADIRAVIKTMRSEV